MRIRFGGIVSTDKKPAPSAEVIQRNEVGLRKAMDLNGIKPVGASDAVVNYLARVGATIDSPSDTHEGIVNTAHAKRKCKLVDNEWAEERRGLLLVGPVGTGKTTALRMVEAVTGCQWVSAVELTAHMMKGGIERVWELVERYQQAELIIDDIGSEGDSKSYGNSVPMEQVLLSRYESWGKYGVRTFISTNLTPKQIKESPRFGLRIHDRLREMCETIVSTGESLR